MDTPLQSQVSIHDALGNIASGNPEEFRIFFRRMRKMFPDEMTEACLWYIASRGLDTAAKNMAFWLRTENKYLNILLDGSSLPPEIACKAAVALKEADPQFLIRIPQGGRANHVARRYTAHADYRTVARRLQCPALVA